MKQVVFIIEENQQLARDVFRMELQGDVSAVTAPGQFVNVKIPGKFLRRPISVCDIEDGRLVLIYKVVGEGTAQLAVMNHSEELDILTGLGNGYDLSCCGERPLLVGGGVGVPPLYWLCRQLISLGEHPMVILGFNKAEEIFYEQEFCSLGAQVKVMTADGSYGGKGFVTDGILALEEEVPYTHIYACGPMPMLKAVNAIAKTPGQFSLEERMGCGFGACMGCSCKTLVGDKRICMDGPVFARDEILW